MITRLGFGHLRAAPCCVEWVGFWKNSWRNDNKKSWLCQNVTGESPLKVGQRAIHWSAVSQTGRFFEFHPKGQHRDLEEEEYNRKMLKENFYGIKDGFKDFRMEIVKWKDEWKTRLTDESEFIVASGDNKLVWKFNSPEFLKTWSPGSDSDLNEGFSRCTLTLSPTGKAQFRGFINMDLPKTGRMKKAGYCAIKCRRIMRSFKREWYLDWSEYTHLIMRVRGDGRSYAINLSTAGYFDVNWNDAYHYTLYTRGGPYWQYVKIPFSKFMLGSKGNVQDIQGRIPLHRIAAVGIATGKVDGPFNLEIDYIGVECDLHNIEMFAYETYYVPAFIAGV